MRLDERGFYNYTEQKGLGNISGYTVYSDAQGVVWIGSLSAGRQGQLLLFILREKEL